MLPCTALRTSAVISVFASSISARTSVETCVVTSLTSAPTEASPVWRTGSAFSGIDGTTGAADEPPPVFSGVVTGPPGRIGSRGGSCCHVTTTPGRAAPARIPISRPTSFVIGPVPVGGCQS